MPEFRNGVLSGMQELKFPLLRILGYESSLSEPRVGQNTAFNESCILPGIPCFSFFGEIEILRIW